MLSCHLCWTNRVADVAACGWQVSPPLVQFKETIGPSPAGAQPRAPVRQATPNKLCEYSFRAVQLPEMVGGQHVRFLRSLQNLVSHRPVHLGQIRDYLTKHTEAFKAAYVEQVAGKVASLSTRTLLDGLKDAFMKSEGWANEWSKLWALGPRSAAPVHRSCVDILRASASVYSDGS